MSELHDIIIKSHIVARVVCDEPTHEGKCKGCHYVTRVVNDFIEAVKKPIAEEKNPYPEDIFIPLSKEDLGNVDKVLQEELGFSIDRLSGHIGRHTLNWHKEKMIEELDKFKQVKEGGEK